MSLHSDTTGALGRILLDSATPFDGASVAFEFISESLQINQELINPDGIRGTRTNYGPRTRFSRRAPGGEVVVDATASFLAAILPYVMGTAGVAGVYNTAESLIAFHMLVDKGWTIEYYENCYISRFRFTSAQGQPLRCSMLIEAEDATGGQSWPGSPPAIANEPLWIHSDAADISLVSSGRDFYDFDYEIDNVLESGSFANNIIRSGRLLAQDRIVTATVGIDPRAENAAVMAGALTDGLSVAFNNGATTLTIASGSFQIARSTSVTPGKGMRTLPVSGRCRGGATNAYDTRITIA